MPDLQLSFESGESSLLVQRFLVEEALSTAFAVSIWAHSRDPALELDAHVGRRASFHVRPGTRGALAAGGRTWSGLCAHAEQVRAEPIGVSTYFFRLVPALWSLGLRRNHRIFQHLAAPDIVDRLLDEWGIEREWAIVRDDYPKLEYKVQYGETDYAFVLRVLEEAGIAFTFVERDGASKLLLCDALQAREPRPGAPLRHVDNPGQAAEEEFITRLHVAREVRPGGYVVRDHDPRRPALALFGKAPPAQGPEARLEQYHYRPGGFVAEIGSSGDTPVADDRGVARHDQAFGDRRAAAALEGERALARVLSFETNAIDLAPGTVFVADVGSEERLLTTALRIEGSRQEEWRTSGHAVSAATPWRPALRTPKPRVRGVQSATVVGAPGDEIHTDEFGRVRVQFPWDREGKRDETSSCWIRSGEGWAGTGHGWLTLPRVGQEVLVSFLDGDPDQPILVGRVFNAAQPVPYKLPESKTISTWKSDSSPGSQGFNEILFEDKKGEELVSIQAERDLRKRVKRDETITVGNDRRKRVGASELETVGVNRTQVTGATRIEITGSDRATLDRKDRIERVEGATSQWTERNRRREVGKDQDIVVKGEKRERIEMDAHLHVRGDRRERIDGKQSRTVVEDVHERVEGTHALQTGKALHLTAGEAIVAEGEGAVTLKGPGGFIRLDGSGITIEGTLVKINVGGSPGWAPPSKPDLPEDARESPVGVPDLEALEG